MYVRCSLPVVGAYVFIHLSLVIGILLRLVGIKECGVGTQVSRARLSTVRGWNRVRAADIF